MILEALESTSLAEHLRASRWTYPLVNAGHVLGIALLVGAVVPLDLRLLRWVPGPSPEAALAFLRPFALAGLAAAIAFGGLLFMARATDYAANPWFRLKMVLLALAAANAALHLRLASARPPWERIGAGVSLALWPAVLLCGRLIGYS